MYFRKFHIVCAIVLAFLPTIEIPISVAAPCWLSFFLELICYVVLSFRILLELVCHKNTGFGHPWFTLLVLSIGTASSQQNHTPLMRRTSFVLGRRHRLHVARRL